MAFVNLHHHEMWSTYDGFDTAQHAVNYAKELGYQGLAITDHGTVSGLIDHYFACNDAGIQPILGIEAYFQPVFDKEKPYYHMLLFAMNLEGYQNLMRAVSEANRDKFFRHPIMDFETLAKYSDNLIATSGCIAGWIPQLIAKNELPKAAKVAKKFQQLFPNRFYFEVQPFDVVDQIVVNKGLIRLSKKLDIPVVLTLDSHYVHPDDYDTYLIMHRIGGREPSADYSRRYLMPETEIVAEWRKTMKTDPTPYLQESVALAARCNVDLHFSEMVPKIDWGMPSKRKLMELAKEGLKEKGCWTSPYKERLKYELKVIFEKQFEDYFLLCYDIISYAKSQDIGVGYGRGSVCGSLLAYAIGITMVDPLIMDTHFERFLRPDKTTIPDVDIDFDSNRRGEVIDYILKRYDGKAAPISTFGYFQIKNLVNDLGKVLEMDPADIAAAKSRLERIVTTDHDIPGIFHDSQLRGIKARYPDFLTHFSKLYGQVRFMGRHAAGVAITADDIDKYVAIIRVRGELQTAYDLGMLSRINVMKMDELGLATVSVVHDAEKEAGITFNYTMLNDAKVYKRFADGDTDGIFQFEKDGAKDILRKVAPANFQELIACNALNRPAPIQLGIVDQYIRGKNGDVDTSTVWYPYTADSYGNIIYQEHVMRICRGLADMPWGMTDKVMKQLRQVGDDEKENDPLRQAFIQGAQTHSGIAKDVAADLYDKMTLYLFNKGHGAGYSLLSFYTMYLKTYYPLEFYWALLKSEEDDRKREVYKSQAVRAGAIILLPHVNGSVRDAIVPVEDDRAIQEGLITIANIGKTSAEAIIAAKPFTSLDDFLERVPKRNRNAKVMEVLEHVGALEFDQKRWMKRVFAYNTTLYSKAYTMH